MHQRATVSHHDSSGPHLFSVPAATRQSQLWEMLKDSQTRGMRSLPKCPSVTLSHSAGLDVAIDRKWSSDRGWTSRGGVYDFAWAQPRGSRYMQRLLSLMIGYRLGLWIWLACGMQRQGSRCRGSLMLAGLLYAPSFIGQGSHSFRSFNMTGTLMASVCAFSSSSSQ